MDERLKHINFFRNHFWYIFIRIFGYILSSGNTEEMYFCTLQNCLKMLVGMVFKKVTVKSKSRKPKSDISFKFL